MWKEKYEELKKEFQAYRDGIDSAAGVARGNGHAAVSTPSDLDAIYAFVKAKALQDGEMIHLLRMTPAIQVNVKRRTLEMSDESTDGRIALLIIQKFFDTPQDGGTITKEFKRRGWLDRKSSNAAVIKPLAKITEMGFLIRDENRYQAVPGMKVNIVEERA